MTEREHHVEKRLGREQGKEEGRDVQMVQSGFTHVKIYFENNTGPTHLHTALQIGKIL